MDRTMGRRNGGLTMIEVMIASVILVAVSAMAMSLLYTATNHVSNMEVRVRLDRKALEVISQMCAELRQTKITTVKVVNITPLPSPPWLVINSSNINAAQTPPGNANTSAYVPYDIVSPQPAMTFTAIRFSIPGHQMDLTKNNANADNGNPNDNFDLSRFKASQTTDWVTEIQYWWEPDIVSYGVPISAGVIKRTETTFDSNGIFKVRHYSVVARDVSALSFTVPKYPAWVTPATAVPAPALNSNSYSGGSEKQVNITIQMQAPDPKTPTKIIQSVLSNSVDVRN